MKQMDTESYEMPGAAGEQKNPEIVDILPPQKRGRGAPLGSANALKHGAYSPRMTPEEESERAAFEAELLQDLAGDASTAQRALIRRAGFLEIRLRRCERATAGGLAIADEHVLSWINAQRLLLCALGLERRQRPGPSLQDYLAQKAEGENRHVNRQEQPS